MGLSAPYWQPNARAAVIGLTPSSSKNHVVRAALEGIAFRIRDVLSLMTQEAAVNLQTVHAAGGAVNNRFLMQFVADLTHLTVLPQAYTDFSFASFFASLFLCAFALYIFGGVHMGDGVPR